MRSVATRRTRTSTSTSCSTSRKDVSCVTNQYRHTPVLLAECLEYLNLETKHTFVDATLGGAGHSLEAAKRLGKDGTLIGIDQDDMVSEAAALKLGMMPEDDRPTIELLHGNFGDMDELLSPRRFPGSMRSCSILGFRLPQLDVPRAASPSRRTAPLICGWIRENRP